MVHGMLFSISMMYSRHIQGDVPTQGVAYIIGGPMYRFYLGIADYVVLPFIGLLINSQTLRSHHSGGGWVCAPCKELTHSSKLAG